MHHVFTRKLPSVRTVKGDPVSSTDVKYLDALCGRFEFVVYEAFHEDAFQSAALLCNTLTPSEMDAPDKFLDGVDVMCHPPSLSPESQQRVRNLKFMGTGAPADRVHHKKPIYPDELSMGALFDGVLQSVNAMVQMGNGSTKYRLVTRRVMSELHRIAEKEKLRNVAELRLRVSKARRLSLEASNRVQAAVGLQRTRWRTQLCAAQMSSGDGEIPTPDSVTLTEGEKLEIEMLVNDAKESYSYLLPDYCLMRFRDLNPNDGESICCIELKGMQKNITGRESDMAWGQRLGASVNLSDECFVEIPSEVSVDSSERLASRLNDVMAAGHEGESDGRSRSARRAVSQALAYALETSSGMCYLWNWGDGVVYRIVPKGSEKGKAWVHVALVNETLQNQPGHVASLLHFCRVAAEKAASKEVGESLEGLRKDIALSISQSAGGGLAGSTASGSTSGGPRQFADAQASGENVGDSQSHAVQNSPVHDEVTLELPAQFHSQELDPSSPVSSEHDKHSPHAIENEQRKRKLGIAFVDADELTAAADVSSSESACFLPSYLAASKLHSNQDDFLLGFHPTDEPTEHEVNALMRTAQVRIGAGMAGVVLEGRLAGRAVAIKLWNKKCMAGLNSLKREIDFYEWLQTFYPATLGCAVPTLRMYWNFEAIPLSRCPESIGLVIDLVGSKIQYKGENVYEVIGRRGSMEVKGTEIRNVRDAALRSLSLLHDSGLLHGDVELRNLRVECYHLEDEGDEGCLHWRAWWIDLGHAEPISPRNANMTKTELSDCRSLFIGFTG